MTKQSVEDMFPVAYFVAVRVEAEMNQILPHIPGRSLSPVRCISHNAGVVGEQRNTFPLKERHISIELLIAQNHIALRDRTTV